MESRWVYRQVEDYAISGAPIRMEFLHSAISKNLRFTYREGIDTRCMITSVATTDSENRANGIIDAMISTIPYMSVLNHNRTRLDAKGLPDLEESLKKFYEMTSHSDRE